MPPLEGEPFAVITEVAGEVPMEAEEIQYRDTAMDDQTVKGETISDSPSLPQNLWPEWRTERLIGEGSAGKVYEIAKETLGLSERAALKVISIPKNKEEIIALKSSGMDNDSLVHWYDEYAKKVISEYRMMMEMKGHSNIVCCDDFRYDRHKDGIGWDIYIKMELLTPLTDLIKKNDLPEAEIVKIGKHICQALILCESRNVIHRDVKPQNIFFSQNGDYKLGDFSVATISEHTVFNTLAGSYRYMAPEVCHNQPYGFRADQYSLGMVLYGLLNDQRMPFEPVPPKRIGPDDCDKALRRRFQGEKIPPPLHGSKWLKKVILKACEFRPEDRFHSIEDMMRELDAGKVPPIPKKTIIRWGIATALLLTMCYYIWPNEQSKVAFRTDDERISTQETLTEADGNANDAPENLVVFGSYEQDGKAINGKEDLQWIVLEEHSDRILLVSRYAIACQSFHNCWADMTWEDCTLRLWLNNTFMEEAFSEVQQDMILQTDVDNSGTQGNSTWNKKGGNDTSDRIFLLSYQEAKRYFDNERARICEPTIYAAENGVWKDANGACHWWLRSPGQTQNFAAYVGSDGALNSTYDYNTHIGVRPAMWVRREALP